MKLTFYSHSTFQIEINSTLILVDPYITDNPIINNNLFLKNKYLNTVVNYILITHAHYDHTADVEYIAKKYNAIVISNYEISNYFNKKNIQTIGLNYGSFIKLKFGKLKYVYAAHSSSFIDGSYGGNPGGFIIKDNFKKTIYIAGDTGLTKEMELIPTFSNLDLAILPIGGKYTMDYSEALIASNFVKCNKILGVHYDTYLDININHNQAIKYFHKNNKELILLNINDSLEL